MVNNTIRPRFIGLFKTKPAPKAETSLSRVISYQFTFLSMRTSTRTGRGSAIRWMRRFSFSTTGCDLARSMARVSFVGDIDILSQKADLESGIWEGTRVLRRQASGL